MLRKIIAHADDGDANHSFVRSNGALTTLDVSALTSVGG